MKTLGRIFVAAIMVCLFSAASFAGQGNGLPSGQRYVLEVIAFDNCPSGDFTGSNRHMIAVEASYAYSPVGKLPSATDKTNTIALTPGTDFIVLDGNACSKGGAEFELPSDVATTYDVYVRLLGKPGTGIDVSTCATDPVTGFVVCSVNQVIQFRTTGKPKTINVTSELLTLCLADGTCYNLFDPALTDYFWQWDTTGKAHAQLIFIATP